MGPRFKSVLGSQQYQRYPDKKLYRDFLFSVDLIHRDFPPCFSEILKDPLGSPFFCPLRDPVLGEVSGEGFCRHVYIDTAIITTWKKILFLGWTFGGDCEK
jgi:hypothetical protein